MVQYTTKRLALSVNGLYKTRQPQSVVSPLIAKVSAAYMVLNAKVDLTVWKNLSAFVEVDNIGDKVYTDLLVAQMPGRWLMGGIKISLSK